jgi:hypothetical protein
MILSKTIHFKPWPPLHPLWYTLWDNWYILFLCSTNQCSHSVLFEYQSMLPYVNHYFLVKFLPRFTIWLIAQYSLYRKRPAIFVYLSSMVPDPLRYRTSFSWFINVHIVLLYLSIFSCHGPDPLRVAFWPGNMLFPYYHVLRIMLTYSIHHGYINIYIIKCRF